MAATLARRAAALGLLAIAGCTFGPGVEDLAWARQPQGAQAVIRVGRDQLLAELLAVQDSALLVLRDGRVLLLPLRSTTSVWVERPDVVVDAPARMTARDREALRVLSRFPQGLTPELEGRLLAAYGQRAPAVVAAP